MDDEILTADQVAKILQVHPFTVLKFIKKGKLKAAKLGRVYRIRKKDLDQFIDSLVENGETKNEKATPVKKTKKEKEKTVIIEESPGKSEETIYGDDHYVIELTEE